MVMEMSAVVSMSGLLGKLGYDTQYFAQSDHESTEINPVSDPGYVTALSTDDFTGFSNMTDATKKVIEETDEDPVILVTDGVFQNHPAFMELYNETNRHIMIVLVGEHTNNPLIDEIPQSNIIPV